MANAGRDEDEDDRRMDLWWERYERDYVEAVVEKHGGYFEDEYDTSDVWEHFWEEADRLGVDWDRDTLDVEAVANASEPPPGWFDDDSWREVLLEASETASTQLPLEEEVAMLRPVVADLRDEPDLYAWLSDYLSMTPDEAERVEIDRADPGDLGDSFVRRTYFRLLDEQIDYASTDQIAGYRRAFERSQR